MSSTTCRGHGDGVFTESKQTRALSKESSTYVNLPAPSLRGGTLVQCCGEQHYLAAPWFELPIDKDDVVKTHIE